MRSAVAQRSSSESWRRHGLIGGGSVACAKLVVALGAKLLPHPTACGEIKQAAAQTALARSERAARSASLFHRAAKYARPSRQNNGEPVRWLHRVISKCVNKPPQSLETSRQRSAPAHRNRVA
jgi:succinate dehydrogenase/fumarate reductase flavoprotein subunit